MLTQKRGIWKNRGKLVDTDAGSFRRGLPHSPPPDRKKGVTLKLIIILQDKHVWWERNESSVYWNRFNGSFLMKAASQNTSPVMRSYFKMCAQARVVGSLPGTHAASLRGWTKPDARVLATVIPLCLSGWPDPSPVTLLETLASRKPGVGVNPCPQQGRPFLSPWQAQPYHSATFSSPEVPVRYLSLLRKLKALEV